MKIFIIVMVAVTFLSCNDHSSNSSNAENSDSVATDPGYMPTTENSPSNGLNDTVTYGTVDSASR